MSEKYTPLEDRVLVRIEKKTEPETTAAGIITDMGTKEVTNAVVFAVGQGRYAGETGLLIPTMVCKGDVVLVGVNNGMPIDVVNESGQKEEMKLMREGDILIVIEKKQS